MLKKLALVMLLGAILAAPAQAKLSVSVVGVGNMTQLKTNETPPQGYSFGNKAGYGAGALIGLPLPGSIFSLELGGLVYQNKYKLSGTDAATSIASETVYSFPVLQVPATLRIWLLGDILSVGAGAYYRKFLGDTVKDTTEATFAGTVYKSSAIPARTYSAAGLKKYDAGVHATIAADLPIFPFVALRLEGRYNRGLTNASSDKSDYVVKMNETQAYAGVTFHL